MNSFFDSLQIAIGINLDLKTGFKNQDKRPF